jgi:2-polyprenyl-3-methyl-5-hydroxy-6-metoxy-1,4-benzoquinol methylase
VTQGPRNDSSSGFGDFDYGAIKDLPEVAVRTGIFGERLVANSDVWGRDQALEVGLGSGDVSLMLSRAFGDVTCLDMEPGIVETVRKRLENQGVIPTFVCSLVEDATFEDDSFDAIVFFGILEHLEDPVSGLRQIIRWLRPGGRIFITVNLANSIHRMLGVAMGMINSVTELSESDHSLGHYRIYTPEELKQNVADAGLSVLYERNFYLKPLPTSMLTKLPMDLHIGLSKLGEMIPEYASYVYMEIGFEGAQSESA